MVGQENGSCVCPIPEDDTRPVRVSLPHRWTGQLLSHAGEPCCPDQHHPRLNRPRAGEELLHRSPVEDLKNFGWPASLPQSCGTPGGSVMHCETRWAPPR